MRILAVIPARFASTRFPGKPLALIHNKPMIQWVYERVSTCNRIDAVIVATDDQRIADAVHAFGGQCVMTSPDHLSGTDRIDEAVRSLDQDYNLILNVQGDEPAIEVGHLEKLIGLFDASVDIGTLVTPIDSRQSFEDPNRVKAILSKTGRAHYFSRAPIPYDRSENPDLSSSYQHLGVYAYRTEVLHELANLEPSPLELKESLEQLRWLEQGYSIQAAIVDHAPIGVDSPSDIERVKSHLK